MADKPIAIIDDDKNLRESIGDLLETEGYQSRLYESAEAFLGERRHADYACIVADVKMPGISGIEMLAIIRQFPDCPPVLVLTSYTDERIRSDALRTGAASFLTKPIDTELLFSALEAAISGTR